MELTHIQQLFLESDQIIPSVDMAVYKVTFKNNLINGYIMEISKNTKSLNDRLMNAFILG